MQTRPIFIAIGLLAASVALADAYKWTDEDGVIHFSDRPHPGATRVDLGESTRRPTPARQSVASTPPPADENAAPFSYETLEVSAPAPEQTLWNIEGVLNVSLALSPALQPGHQVRVYFDGTPRTVSSTNFQLQDVYRGAHNLQAEVLDETGTLMIRSLPNRFYVQQTTVRR
jgi:hypothetical protein